MLKEFRDFVLRGSVVDLAVGIVIGAAFTAVITAFTAAFITPLLGALVSTDFSRHFFTLNDVRFSYGDFIDALIAFLLTAAVVFFFVVRPINKLMERFKTEPEVQSPTKDCPECLSKVPSGARRCAFCTTQLTAA